MLAGQPTREIAAQLYKQDELRRTHVELGFHEAAGKTAGPAPSSDQLVQLRADGFTGKQIWTAVLIAAVRSFTTRALMGIGVIEKRSESRINVPDIFRVAAKLKRRGGVRVPPRRA